MLAFTWMCWTIDNNCEWCCIFRAFAALRLRHRILQLQSPPPPSSSFSAQQGILHNLVLNEYITYVENVRIATEIKQEHTSLHRRFSKWLHQMSHYWLEKKPLNKHWITQTDRHTGETYWFNLKTGGTSQQHPCQCPCCYISLCLVWSA